MSIKDQYLAYAAAFEQTYEDDDWGRIAPYFSEAAVYEGGPEPARGRDTILAMLEGSVNALDRKMDSRTLHFEEPSVDGDTVSVQWSATYAKAGCPDLVISGSEHAAYEGDQIALLRDEFDPAAQAAMQQWMEQYGSKL